jgi:Flp pilus assembly protein TadD
MGIDQYKAGRFAEAIALLENAVAAGEGDAVAYYQLGLAYMASTGRPQALADAELAFRSAIALQPDWAAPHQLLAESLIRRDHFKEAISPAQEATRLDPLQADAWLTLGRAYQGNGQDAEATKAYAEAARLAPAPPSP